MHCHKKYFDNFPRVRSVTFNACEMHLFKLGVCSLLGQATSEWVPGIRSHRILVHEVICPNKHVNAKHTPASIKRCSKIFIDSVDQVYYM